MAEAIYQLLEVLLFCDWLRTDPSLLKISGEIFLVKMCGGAFQGVYVLSMRTKRFKSNLVLVVIPVPLF